MKNDVPWKHARRGRGLMGRELDADCSGYCGRCTRQSEAALPHPSARGAA